MSLSNAARVESILCGTGTIAPDGVGVFERGCVDHGKLWVSLFDLFGISMRQRCQPMIQTDRAVPKATGHGPRDQARATSASLDKPR